jgi:hypothetical protein
MGITGWVILGVVVLVLIYAVTFTTGWCGSARWRAKASAASPSSFAAGRT